MKYHALIFIFEKWQNLKLSSAAVVIGALWVKGRIIMIKVGIGKNVISLPVKCTRYAPR